MNRRPYVSLCESCCAPDRALVWHGFFRAALCVQCAEAPPAAFVDECARKWHGPKGRVISLPITIPPELLPGGEPRRFTGKMYAQ